MVLLPLTHNAFVHMCTYEHQSIHNAVKDVKFYPWWTWFSNQLVWQLVCVFVSQWPKVLKYALYSMRQKNGSKIVPFICHFQQSCCSVLFRFKAYSVLFRFILFHFVCRPVFKGVCAHRKMSVMCWFFRATLHATRKYIYVRVAERSIIIVSVYVL